MNKSLYEIFEMAQGGNEDQVIQIYNIFLPLIKGYARKLDYEEANSDLTIFLLEFIKKIDLKKFKSRSDGEIVNYMRYTFKSKYINVLKTIMNKKIETSILETEPICNDCYKKLESEYIFEIIRNLSGIQKKIIIGKYVNGYSDKELSLIFNISRQAIHKQRKRALELIKKELSERDI